MSASVFPSAGGLRVRFSQHHGIDIGVKADPRTPLVDLLGQTRGRLVGLLSRGPRSVAAIAVDLGVSEVAVRRHLQLLERDGLVAAETVRRPGPGRPGAQYRLTAKARRLFPDGSAELANELLDYVQAEHGRTDLLRFLRWRQERHGIRYATALAGLAESDTGGRADRLAELLSDDGFQSEVAETPGPDGRVTLTLTQGHCAIKDVAQRHPEICAFEAALFQRLLGAKLSRRQTIAGGASECVCHITPQPNPQTSNPQV
jgi:predicted ArsR family transcriptional regulator